MKQQMWFTFVVILIVLAGMVGAVLWLQGRQASEQTSDASHTENSDWKSYQSNELGISFRYPAILGVADIKLHETQISGNFSMNSDALTVGGITKEYTAARSVYYRDFSGFKKEGDTYFFESVGDLRYPIQPKKIISANILLVDCMSYEEKCNATGPSVSSGVAGLINLPAENSPGMILMADGNVITEDTLVEILSSFEFSR